MKIMKYEQSMTPEEKYEEAMFELAAYRMLQHDQEAIDASLSEEDKHIITEIAESASPSMLKMIDKTLQRKEWKNRLIKSGMRILKTAAVVVLVLNLSLTIATASSKSVRVKVIEFLTEINSSYLSIGYKDTGEEAVIPDGWPERYYPSYIPEGYSLVQNLPCEGDSTAVYRNTEGKQISITVCGLTASTNINVEGAQIFSISMHGTSATVISQDYGETDIFWVNGDHYFIISCEEGYEMAYAVAQSMAIIQK